MLKVKLANVERELASLQDLIAAGFTKELQAGEGPYRVLLTVSLSDGGGNIFHTIKPQDRSLTGERFVRAYGMFGKGMDLGSHRKRIVAISQLAGYVFAQLEMERITVRASYRIAPNPAAKFLDGNVHVFVKDDCLVINEIKTTPLSEAVVQAKPLPRDSGEAPQHDRAKPLQVRKIILNGDLFPSQESARAA